MEIVCFEQKYEEELIELWNQTMIFDPVSADKFRTQVLLDENFDRELCLLARTKDRVVGFILGIKRRFPYLERGLEPDRGWISLMFVAKEFRRRGIGTSLVCEIEKRLLYLGAETITLAAYSPNYFFPGIDIQGYPEAAAFFEARGYKDCSVQGSPWIYHNTRVDGEKESCREERICIPEFSVDGYVKAAGLCEDEFRRRLEEKSFACYAGGGSRRCDYGSASAR